MKGSSVLSENILTGLSIIISFILIILVVRTVISYQTERTYENLLGSIGRDIVAIVDRLSSTTGSGLIEYNIPKGVHINLTIDYKSVFVLAGKDGIKKFFSGNLNSGPYVFDEPEVLCFVKSKYDNEVVIVDEKCSCNIKPGVCDIIEPTITTTTVITTTTLSGGGGSTTTTLPPEINFDNYNPWQGLFQCHVNNAIEYDYVKGGAIIITLGEMQPDNSEELSESAVSNLISQIKTDKKIYLHFMIYRDEYHMNAFPSWVKFNLIKDSMGLYPQPWDPVYQESLKKFLELLNDALDENGVKNQIEYIEPAVGGLWASTGLYSRSIKEWIAAAGCRPDNYTCLGEKYNQGVNKIIDIYSESFPDTPLMIIGGGCIRSECNYNGFNQVLGKYGMKVMFKMAGLGARPDCGFREYSFNPICGNNAKTKCGQEPTGKSIVCGKPTDFFNSSDPCGKNYNQIYTESLKREKISYYCMYIDDIKCGKNQETNKFVAQHLGAQIELVSFELNPNNGVEAGSSFNINFNWRNTGSTALIAPLKNGLKWEASSYKQFLEFEKDGEIVYYKEFDVNPPTNTWQTANLLYETSSSITLNIPDSLKNPRSDTAYKLYVGFTDPNGENIRFRLNNVQNNDFEHRRYLLTDSFVVRGGG